MNNRRTVHNSSVVDTACVCDCAFGCAPADKWPKIPNPVTILWLGHAKHASAPTANVLTKLGRGKDNSNPWLNHARYA
eukprot:689354-Alexandrium_andersonii.AAC.1